MELRVYDLNSNVVSIRYRDVFNVKLINRRVCYFTDHGTYYGPINLLEQAELHENQGMFQIGKNSLININHIETIIKGSAYVRGKKHLISRRRRSKILRIWKIRQKSTE